MQILQATLAIAVCACLAGCNARFDADFEADTPGAPPALNPPGAPNDEIVIHTSPANGGGIVIRVTDEPDLVPAGGPHRFMSLEHEPDPGSSSVASLVTAPMATGTRSIFLQWEQVLDAGGTGTIAIFGHPDDSPSDPGGVSHIHRQRCDHTRVQLIDSTGHRVRHARCPHGTRANRSVATSHRAAGLAGRIDNTSGNDHVRGSSVTDRGSAFRHSDRARGAER
jgi:hypothetical protein